MRILLLVSFFCLGIRYLYPIVIIVHGSFGAGQNWWRPGGDFFTALEAQAKILGHMVIPFCWSGKPTDLEMARASQVLVKVIESYQGQPIILVGHSHGGNIINEATQLLDKLQSGILDQIHLINSITKPNSQLLLLDHSPTLRQNNGYLIEKIYLLGTPVCTKKYYPEMKVVESVINLFSDGDYIQPVLGLYQREYPPHDRIANVALRFGAQGQSLALKPGHSQLHDQLVGRWLLNIPDLLIKEGVGNVVYLPLSS